MDGRPRPGLPSGKECCKQSNTEQLGYPSVRRLLDVHEESETPSMSGEGEHKFIFNLVTTPAFDREVITESFACSRS